jgi:glucosamine--fructose-6-phosphate aminotransferase (isomerizing)
LFCFALALGKERIGFDRGNELVKAILTLPRLMGEALKLEANLEQIAARLSKKENAIFIGRGLMNPLALEGALKLKEISYIHAEGFAAGELKHGSIALIEDDMPVITIAPKDAMYPKTISNMQEVIARQGDIILLTEDPGNTDTDNITDLIFLPEIDPLLTPILYTIPLQLLAYHTAVAKGTDVDQPRNLAKSVTVE